MQPSANEHKAKVDKVEWWGLWCFILVIPCLPLLVETHDLDTTKSENHGLVQIKEMKPKKKLSR